MKKRSSALARNRRDLDFSFVGASGARRPTQVRADRPSVRFSLNMRHLNSFCPKWELQEEHARPETDARRSCRARRGGGWKRDTPQTGRRHVVPIRQARGADGVFSGWMGVILRTSEAPSGLGASRVPSAQRGGIHHGTVPHVQDRFFGSVSAQGVNAVPLYGTGCPTPAARRKSSSGPRQAQHAATRP